MTTSHAGRSPTLPNWTTESDDDHTPSRPLSGPGTSRQTQRLQLRNAGFRGAALPTRRVTPKSISSSNWSSVTGVHGASDLENMSPVGTRVGSAATKRRTSSGVLQEIGNSTVTRRKKPRPRLSSNKVFDLETTAAKAAYDDLPTSPPPPPKSTIRPRSAKARTKVSHPRRSVSAETSKYIEHLESELADAQSQLSSITSPTVTRQQSSKMRNLNVETKHLQEELAEWELKYERRVQEEVDKHYAVESGLRGRIRDLEQDAEDRKFKIQELEVQLDCTSQNLQAVEIANLKLEKRLEIMSDLLASNKLDLHAETPGRAKRHVRPQSMLPRFPTASSLMGSPERQPRTQPVSPLFSFADHSLPSSPSHSILPLDNSPQHTDSMSEGDGSVFSEESVTGDSITSADTFDGRASFNPSNLPPQRPQNTASRPARRMRRFGAGSLGPKPLILPSTSQQDQFPPASAPPLERSETTPALFPPRSGGSDEIVSPTVTRRRALTTSDQATIANLAASPFHNLTQEDFANDTVLSPSTPPSAHSHVTSRRYSSIGSTAGRNLMDELFAARSEQTAASAEPSIEDTNTAGELYEEDVPVKPVEVAIDMLTAVNNEDLQPAPALTTSLGPPSSITPLSHLMLSDSLGPTTCHSQSMFDRLRILFGDLWRSPVALARHLVQTAQARMRIPRSLLNVQWWLVGVLLGPMAKRRMLAGGSGCCVEDLEEQPLLLEDTPSRGPSYVSDGGLAYGTSGTGSPPASSFRTGGSMRGRSWKRTGSKMRCTHRRARHSPWLWIKFSITLAFAIGTAFMDGPGSLLKRPVCGCNKVRAGEIERDDDQDT